MIIESLFLWDTCLIVISFGGMVRRESWDNIKRKNQNKTVNILFQQTKYKGSWNLFSKALNLYQVWWNWGLSGTYFQVIVLKITFELHSYIIKKYSKSISLQMV